LTRGLVEATLRPTVSASAARANGCISTVRQFTASLLGPAIGDALDRPVEGRRQDELRDAPREELPSFFGLDVSPLCSRHPRGLFERGPVHPDLRSSHERGRAPGHRHYKVTCNESRYIVRDKPWERSPGLVQPTGCCFFAEEAWEMRALGLQPPATGFEGVYHGTQAPEQALPPAAAAMNAMLKQIGVGCG
jgi:hypothetical protein